MEPIANGNVSFAFWLQYSPRESRKQPLKDGSRNGIGESTSARRKARVEWMASPRETSGAHERDAMKVFAPQNIITGG